MSDELATIREELRELARRVFASHDGADQGDMRAAARRNADAGLIGVATSVGAGGVGFGAIEACIVLEEAGRALALGPLIETLAVIAALEANGDAALVRRWAAPAVRGEMIILPCGMDGGAALRVDSLGDGTLRLHGEISGIPHAPDADAFLVAAMTPDSALLLVPRGATGVTIEAQRLVDLAPGGRVGFDGVRVAADAILTGVNAPRVMRDWLRIGAAAAVLGLSGEALRRTAAYVSERVQFGAPLATRQAVLHRLADGFIDVEAMRATLRQAASALDAGEEGTETDVAVAKYWAAAGVHRIVHTAQHLHGGIGADVSFPIHRFFLAAARLGPLLGGGEAMLAELGARIASGAATALT